MPFHPATSPYKNVPLAVRQRLWTVLQEKREDTPGQAAVCWFVRFLRGRWVVGFERQPEFSYVRAASAQVATEFGYDPQLLFNCACM